MSNKIRIQDINIILFGEIMINIPNSSAKRKIYEVLKAEWKFNNQELTDKELEVLNKFGGMELFNECNSMMNMHYCGMLDDESLVALRDIFGTAMLIYTNDYIEELYEDHNGVDIPIDEFDFRHRLHAGYRL